MIPVFYYVYYTNNIVIDAEEKRGVYKTVNYMPENRSFACSS